MRLLLLFLIIASAVVLSTTAHAQSETDRLREALRTTTGQLRQLEDQRAALQARATAAEQDRDRLRKQNETLRAQVK